VYESIEPRRPTDTHIFLEFVFIVSDQFLDLHFVNREIFANLQIPKTFAQTEHFQTSLYSTIAMARKRRKGEEKTEDGDVSKRRKLGVPADTNVQVLPPRSQPVRTEDPSQVRMVFALGECLMFLVKAKREKTHG
jgi:hypothetical protein